MSTLTTHRADRPVGAGAGRVGAVGEGPRPQDRTPGLRGRAADALRRHRLVVVVAVQALSVAGIVVFSRLVLLGQGLRLDESQSLQQTGRSYGAMLAQVAQDVHVPGYHLLLRTWRLAFGMDVETARTLSLLFFVACVPVLYLVARRALSTRWALFAVVLLSASPFLNWYGNEARMYSLLVLAALVSQYFFLRLLREDGAGVWAGYAATAVVGAYTHYFFLFVLVVQGLFFLAARRHQQWRGLGRMAATAALVVVALLPWLLYFRASGAASGTRPNLPSPSSVDVTNVYSQFAFGFQGDAANSVLVSTWPLVMLAALAAVRVASRPRRETGYLVAAAFGPVLLAFVVSHTVTPFFLSRYMIAALPAALLLVVVFIASMGRRLAAVLAVVALAVTVTATAVQTANPDAPVKEDYRTAAELLEVKTTAQDVVVLSSPFTIWPFETYYDGAAAVTTMPAWDRRSNGSVPAFDPTTLPAQVDALADGHQRVYLLLSYDQGYEETVYEYFQQHYEKMYEQELTPGMRVVGYRVGYDQLAPVGDLQLTQPLSLTYPLQQGPTVR